MNRFLEALAFLIVSKSRNAYQKLTNTYSEETDDNKSGSTDEKPAQKVDPS